MFKRLNERKEASPLPPSDFFRGRSLGSRFRELFRPTHKLGSSIGIFHRMQSFFSNLGRSRDRTEEVSRKAMDVLRSKDPGLEPPVHVKDTVRKNPTASRQLATFPAFTPGYLEMAAKDLCDSVTNALPEKDSPTEHRLKIQTHIMAADRIHNSLWENFRFDQIDRNLSLGEGNTPESVMKTLDAVAKLDLDPASKKSIEVLQQSVSHYQQKLRT